MKGKDAQEKFADFLNKLETDAYTDGYDYALHKMKEMLRDECYELRGLDKSAMSNTVQGLFKHVHKDDECPKLKHD